MMETDETRDALKGSGSLGKPKILMVDDRSENLVALDRLLSPMEVELYPATSGNEALRLTLHHNFALALLDIQMPGMDGYELAEILRAEEKTARLPFIFISAIYTDHIHVFQGYEKGAFSFITKPFEPLVLTSKVEFFVEKFQQEQMLIQTQKILKQQVKELQQANEELEAFSYSVSHDLRAPLRAIDGYSRIMLQDYQDQLDEEGKRYLSSISGNTGKMTQLIEDILNFSRLGKAQLEPGIIQMGALLREVYDELTEEEKYGVAEFVVAELPEVTGDRNLLRQVIYNLLSNALKYSSKVQHPRIEVGLKREQEREIFYVKDNGAGFDMSHYKKLFSVFRRLHGESEFPGNGIGLAFVKRIIERHSGEIWAESVAGNGATFYFTLNET